MTSPPSPVPLTATDDPGRPPGTPELEDLYRGFDKCFSDSHILERLAQDRVEIDQKEQHA